MLQSYRQAQSNMVNSEPGMIWKWGPVTELHLGWVPELIREVR